MKIQYLYIDDSFKDILNNAHITGYNILQKGSLFIFYFERNGDSEESAKSLSVIDEKLQSVLEKGKWYKLQDGAGEYFNKILYPLCNKFERLLREVLSICSFNNQEKEALKFCHKLESLELVEIYNFFFTDKKINNKIQNVMQGRNLTKSDLVDFMFDDENTLWAKMFGEKYAEVAKSFIEIKDIRNDVMHAKNINYYKYQKAKEKIDKINDMLTEILNQMLEGSILIEDDSKEKLLLLLKEIEAMDIPDEEKVDRFVKSILIDINSRLEKKNG